MKKVLLGLALVLSLTACIEQVPNNAIFSGKIENYGTKEATLIKADRSFRKKIAIDSNGFFCDTIKANPGLYRFIAGNNSTRIYLGNGSNIQLTADANDFNSSLTISGTGAETTQYIVMKAKMLTDFKGPGMDFYKLEEPEFKQKAKTIYATLTAQIDTLHGIDPDYKRLEKRNLNYSYLLELSRYAGGYHRHWAKKRGYRASEGFLAELQEIDLNNATDFHFSDAYVDLVNRHYNEQIKQLIRKDSIDYGLVKVTIYATVPNPIIRNELIFASAENDIYNTGEFEAFYQIFMNASTDEAHNAKITAIYKQLTTVNPGKPSPQFTNYETHAGGTLSLDDLKGKYTYIDVWATWCSPCVAELPYLKQLEQEYRGKNIHFLSISVDAAKDHDKWKEMVVDKGMQGIQVMADKSFTSDFVQAYFIRSIPRFILIDPEGVIVTQHAPKPSDPGLVDLFNSLNI